MISWRWQNIRRDFREASILTLKDFTYFTGNPEVKTRTGGGRNRPFSHLFAAPAQQENSRFRKAPAKKIAPWRGYKPPPPPQSTNFYDGFRLISASRLYSYVNYKKIPSQSKDSRKILISPLFAALIRNLDHIQAQSTFFSLWSFASPRGAVLSYKQK